MDKEVLRLWYMNHSECDPYDTSVPLPDAPQELVQELSCRYDMLFCLIFIVIVVLLLYFAYL